MDEGNDIEDNDSLCTEEEEKEALHKARYYLSMMPCDYPEDALRLAFEETKYPYGLQTVVKNLLDLVKEGYYLMPKTKLLPPPVLNPFDFNYQKVVIQNEYHYQNTNIKKIAMGKLIQRAFQGKHYDGVVISKNKDLYRVLYDDGDEEDLEAFEIFKYSYPRPKFPPCLGRRLFCLELFAGTCMVSDAFYDLEWNVASNDIESYSNASIIKDILEFTPEKELDQVPDFIWASPPCNTYSFMAGGRHRAQHNLDKSPEARHHNFIFMKLIQIVTWAKTRHPHLVFIIENPLGRMQNMPLMKEFERHFNLKRAEVNYCTFGRDERKRTHLWTNDEYLYKYLNEFRCSEEKCCVKGFHQPVQGNLNYLDFASIPERLAKEVAKIVNAKFVLDRIQRFESASPKIYNGNCDGSFVEDLSVVDSRVGQIDDDSDMSFDEDTVSVKSEIFSVTTEEQILG